MDKNYSKQADNLEEKKEFEKYYNDIADGKIEAKDTIIDEKYIQLSLKFLKSRWTKTNGSQKEKDVQNDIVKHFMSNKSLWKVICQEAEYPREAFKGGFFSETTTDNERFDLIVMSKKGLGFIELKVNNKNINNLLSHYEHMQFVKEKPNLFIEDVTRRFEIIKEFGLWPKEEFRLFSTDNIWFGFLFVGGTKEKSIEIISNYLGDKLINDDETLFMYFEGDIDKLDINEMNTYKRFKEL